MAGVSSDAPAVVHLLGDLAGKVSRKAYFLLKNGPSLKNAISLLIPVIGDVLGQICALTLHDRSGKKRSLHQNRNRSPKKSQKLAIDL